MAINKERIIQELQTNYETVQTKKLEYMELKNKANSSLKTELKSHTSELQKSLKEINSKSANELKENEINIKAEQERFKKQESSLINERKKVTRLNTSEIKKLTSNYEIHKKDLLAKIEESKTTFAEKLSEIEDKQVLDVSDSNTRRQRFKEEIKSKIEMIINEVNELEKEHELKLIDLEENYRIKLDEFHEKSQERVRKTEESIEDLIEKKNQTRSNKVEKNNVAVETINNKIKKEEEAYNKKVSSLEDAFSSKIERQEKFKAKREEENDQKGVRERTKEIKKLNSDRDAQLRILNKNHLKDSKKLNSDKQDLIKSQIIALVDFDKDQCALIEGKKNDLELIKIKLEEDLKKIELTYRKNVDKEKVKHNKLYESLEKKKNSLIFDSTNNDIEEDLVLATTEEEYKRTKAVLSENYDKEQAELEYKLRELEHTYNYDVEVADITFEFDKIELDSKEQNMQNEHRVETVKINENYEISNQSLVYSMQFAKNLELLKSLNSFAIHNVENNDSFISVEKVEIQNRYKLRLKQLKDESKERVNKCSQIKTKLETFYNDETEQYNLLIDAISGSQIKELETYKSNQLDEIRKITEERDNLPKRGNRKQIKALNSKLKLMESDLEGNLKEMQFEIDQKTGLYSREIENAKHRYESGIEQIESFENALRNSYAASVSQLEQQRDAELNDIKERHSLLNGAAKSFDLSARQRRELTIDQNKAYQNTLVEQRKDTMKKVSEQFKEDRRKNTETVKVASDKKENVLSVKKQKLESTLKPIREKLISTVARCNATKDKVNDKAKEQSKMAESVASKRIEEAKKTEKASNEKTRSEIAGREALLSFSKNEINSEEQNIRKIIDNKIKEQNKKHKEQLAFEMDKISNNLTKEISEIMQ